jgi:hypothetical protein
VYDAAGLVITGSSISWRGLSIARASVERADAGRPPRGAQFAEAMFTAGAISGLIVVFAIEGCFERVLLTVGRPLLALMSFLCGGE